jgi:DNA repair exonuclease SbcCD ATPase subunit
MSSDVTSHGTQGTESLVDKIFHLSKQLESRTQKYEDLQVLYTKAVTTNRDLKLRVWMLKNENELLNERMDQRERFHDARCRRLQLQYDRLQVRYRDLRDNYYKEKNEHGDYGFDLTGYCV